MSCDFEEELDRRHSDSIKWNHYDEDVLPLWVADMDFKSSEAIVEALRSRVEHGVFGYACEPPELRPAIQAHLKEQFNWEIAEDWLIFLPGVITGFNLALQTLTNPGEGVLIQTPVYPPILTAYKNAQLSRDEMELTQRPDGHYEIDWDAFEAAITPQTRVFLLCNPHNPVGRVFGRDELERMAEICQRHEIAIVSDEIHADLVFSESRHTSIASLDPEIGRRSVTLMAPSKTFNIAGLDCSFAVIPDEDLRCRFQSTRRGVVGGVNLFGLTAAVAAYQSGKPWLEDVLAYLQGNRDYLLQAIPEQLPGVRMVNPEGTYLAWLDCRALGLPEAPSRFFLEKARVAMNDGATFGKGGDGFCRMNYGCSRQTLEEALARMQNALETELVR